MAFNAVTYALSKKYTDTEVAGGGAIQGKNCVISSIVDIPATESKPAGQRVTFQWTLDNGTVETDTMDVYNGKDGESIDRMYVNEEGHLIVVYDSGDEEDCGEITIPSSQADWNETDPTENSYIQNKPNISAIIDAVGNNTNAIGAINQQLSTIISSISTETNVREAADTALRNAIADIGTYQNTYENDAAAKAAYDGGAIPENAMVAIKDSSEESGYKLVTYVSSVAPVEKSYSAGPAGTHSIGTGSFGDLTGIKPGSIVFDHSNEELFGVQSEAKTYPFSLKFTFAGNSHGYTNFGSSSIFIFPKSGEYSFTTPACTISINWNQMNGILNETYGVSDFLKAGDICVVSTNGNTPVAIYTREGNDYDVSSAVAILEGTGGMTFYGDGYLTYSGNSYYDNLITLDNSSVITMSSNSPLERMELIYETNGKILKKIVDTSDIPNIEASLVTKANVNHTHKMSDITDLQDISAIIDDVNDNTNAISAINTQLSSLVDSVGRNTSAITSINAKLTNLTYDSEDDVTILQDDLIVMNDVIAETLQMRDGRNAGFHNSIYRGKNLGASITLDQWTEIRAGTFDNLFIGDYWTLNGTVYRIADFDYFLKSGDSDECTDHHVVIVPDVSMDFQNMNDNNFTTGAYEGSKMYAMNMTTVKAKIKADFGNTHILTHEEYLADDAENGKQSAGDWYDSEIDLMTESMVYGAPHFASFNDGITVPSNFSIGCKQLNLFRYRPDLISNRQTYWLRDVVSVYSFANVDENGCCEYHTASSVLGVRPAFCIYNPTT